MLGPAKKETRKDRVCSITVTLAENPASRGTETSAVVLVGPPWRMESNAGQQQWY